MRDVCGVESVPENADLDLVYGDDLTHANKVKCRELLGEFRDRISTSMTTIGNTDAAKLDIKVTTQEPVVCNPYRMSPHEKEILRGIVDDLLVNGIIRESTSEYASPVLLVKKKTGDYRMCVDYTRLNAITVKDKYPLPLVADQLDRLGGDGKGGKFK